MYGPLTPLQKKQMLFVVIFCLFALPYWTILLYCRNPDSQSNASCRVGYCSQIILFNKIPDKKHNLWNLEEIRQDARQFEAP